MTKWLKKAQIFGYNRSHLHEVIPMPPISLIVLEETKEEGRHYAKK